MCEPVDGGLSCVRDTDTNEKNKRAMDVKTNKAEKRRERVVVGPKEMGKVQSEQ